MFTDPQTVTVATVPKSLNKTGSGDYASRFESIADGLTLNVTHVKGKRYRHTIRFDVTKTAADPLLDGVSRQYSMSCYLVVDAPAVGFSVTEQSDNAQALIDWLDGAGVLSKLTAFES